jgi:hypothetical protein
MDTPWCPDCDADADVRDEENIIAMFEADGRLFRFRQSPGSDTVTFDGWHPEDDEPGWAFCGEYNEHTPKPIREAFERLRAEQALPEWAQNVIIRDANQLRREVQRWREAYAGTSLGPVLSDFGFKLMDAVTDLVSDAYDVLDEKKPPKVLEEWSVE